MARLTVGHRDPGVFRAELLALRSRYRRELSVLRREVRAAEALVQRHRRGPEAERAQRRLNDAAADLAWALAARESLLVWLGEIGAQQPVVGVAEHALDDADDTDQADD